MGAGEALEQHFSAEGISPASQRTSHVSRLSQLGRSSQGGSNGITHLLMQQT